VRMKNGRSHTYTPEKTESFETKVYFEGVKYRPAQLFDGPLLIEATFYRTRPKSKPKAKYPATKPDLGNLIKSVCDALQGVIYTNDSRFVDKLLHKRYGDPPRVEIKILEVEDAQY